MPNSTTHLPISLKQKLGFGLTRIFIRLFVRRGMQAGARVLFKNRPILEIHPSAKVILGDDVMLNSMQRRYHAAMPSPVRLYAEEDALIEIGSNSRIHGSCIHARQRISIGRNCLMAANCQIMDSSGHDLSFDDVDRRIQTSGSVSPIVIEDSVWLGMNCIVLPGVTIGRGSVIGAGSVVTKSIPSMCFAAGSPAKVVYHHEVSQAANPLGSSK